MVGDGYLEELARQYEAMELRALEGEMVLMTRELAEAEAGTDAKRVIRNQLAVCEMVLERRRADAITGLADKTCGTPAGVGATAGVPHLIGGAPGRAASWHGWSRSRGAAPAFMVFLMAPTINDLAFPLDRTSSVPVWKQLAGLLRNHILSGGISPGEALPSEPELHRVLGISPSTTRRAIAVLRQDGLVDTRHGRGTYARRPVGDAELAEHQDA